MPRELDDVDRRLIEELRKDGRQPNKRLAEILDIAETTVASRLRQLRDDRIMLVTLRQDLYSKGFNLQCFADIYVSGRPVDAVARDLARLEAMSSVSLLMGTPQLLAVFNAVDRRDMLAIIDDRIAHVKGITRVEIHVALDIRRYEAGYANLSAVQ